MSCQHGRREVVPSSETSLPRLRLTFLIHCQSQSDRRCPSRGFRPRLFADDVPGGWTEHFPRVYPSDESPGTAKPIRGSRLTTSLPGPPVFVTQSTLPPLFARSSTGRDRLKIRVSEPRTIHSCRQTRTNAARGWFLLRMDCLSESRTPVFPMHLKSRVPCSHLLTAGPRVSPDGGSLQMCCTDDVIDSTCGLRGCQRSVLAARFQGHLDAKLSQTSGGLRGLFGHSGGCKILPIIPGLPNRYNLDDFGEIRVASLTLAEVWRLLFVSPRYQFHAVVGAFPYPR